MTAKRLTATALCLLLAVGAAAAQGTGGTPGNAAGSGATDARGTTDPLGKTGTLGNTDPNVTGSTSDGNTAKPPDSCALTKTARDAAQPNQNNASGGCVK